MKARVRCTMLSSILVMFVVVFAIAGSLCLRAPKLEDIRFELFSPTVDVCINLSMHVYEYTVCVCQCHSVVRTRLQNPYANGRRL